MRARDIIESSDGKMPEVRVVVCPKCETRWSVNGMRVTSGKCDCGAPLRKEQAS